MFGIDISEHQADRNFNWDQLAKSVDFIILRLAWTGDRKLHYDECFDRFYNEARAHNIPVGVYVYLYNQTEEGAQRAARWAVQKLGNRTIQLPFYADIEEPSMCIQPRTAETIRASKAKITAITKAFNDAIEGAGYYAGVYANLNWFRNYLDESIRDRYTCWIAHYTSGTDKYKGSYDVWQNSSNGDVAGISGRVDTNYLYNEKLLTCNDGDAPAPQPEPEPEPQVSFDWEWYYNGSTPEKVYETSALNKSIGMLNPLEECWCYGQKNGNPIVAYYVDGRDYAKAGFVDYTGKVGRYPVPHIVWQNGSTTEKVYKESTLKTEIGSLRPYERCYCIDRFKSGAYLVLYKIDNKNEYKVGFVKYKGGVNI